MTRTALLSTGAMTRDPIQTDHGEIVRHGPELGVPGFELAIFSAWYGHLDDVISDLRESGLSFPAVHAEKAIGDGLASEAGDEVDDVLQRLELNCRAAAALGARTLVLHLWERPSGDRMIERNLERLPVCLDMAGAYNLTLAVETIPGDVGTPLANVRLALERDARCRIALDTEFLAFHGELDASIQADWLWADKAVRHVHVKDFDGRLWHDGRRRDLLPGEGSQDLPRFPNRLVQREYSGAVPIEATAIDDKGGLDRARLAQMAAVVTQLGS